LSNRIAIIWWPDHEITAFSRRPQELAGVTALKQIVHGDALCLEDVRKAVAGQDAVISAVGSSAIARNLIVAMRELGVPRLVMTSSRSVVATRPKLSYPNLVQRGQRRQVA
jgi:putative NADH-flavin reductase